MEFCDLGSHCSLEECRRQDYLPFQCKYCSNFYCLEHRSVSDHNCFKYKDEEENEKKNKKTRQCFFCKKKTKLELKCSICRQYTCYKHYHYHFCSKKKEISRDKKKMKHNISCFWLC